MGRMFDTALQLRWERRQGLGMMKLLLLGTTGFIGRNVKETWENRYHLCTPARAELDLLDEGTVERYLRNGKFDAVFHMANANLLTHPEWMPCAMEYNLRMFCNLERCHDLYGRMIYFGSGAEYHMEHYVPQMPESYFGKHIPKDPYGFSKYIMSKMAAGNIYDLRLFGVFGKYEEWQRRFISNMIYRNLTGQVLQINQNMYFDYLYVNDLIPILEWFLNHEPVHHHYNVCSGQRVELLSLARMVIEETGIPGEITILQDGLKTEYTGSNRRLQEELGRLRFTPVRTAVQELIQYYREYGFEKPRGVL